jgi:hypothetical protein
MMLRVGILVLSVLLRGFIQSRDTSGVDKKNMILHIQHFFSIYIYDIKNPINLENLNLQCWEEQSGIPPPPPGK